MRVTRKDGVTTCTLNAKEKTGTDNTIAMCDQLAYHYAGTASGDSMAGVVEALTALQADTEICPPAGDGEQPKGD